MNGSNSDFVQQIETWLDQHQDAIGRRAAARAATAVFWNRRLRRLNAGLGAALMLMAAQVGWGLWLLLRLQGVAFSLREIVRFTLS